MTIIDTAPVVDLAPADTGTAIHWVCAMALDHPLIALCGWLCNGRRPDEAKITCPDCVTGVREHAATCGYCARWAQALGVPGA